MERSASGTNVIVQVAPAEKLLPEQPDKVGVRYPAAVVVAVTAYASPTVRTVDVAPSPSGIVAKVAPDSDTITVEVAPFKRPCTLIARVPLEAPPQELPVHVGFTVIVDEAVLVLVLVSSSVTVAQFVSTVSGGVEELTIVSTEVVAIVPEAISGIVQISVPEVVVLAVKVVVPSDGVEVTNSRYCGKLSVTVTFVDVAGPDAVAVSTYVTVLLDVVVEILPTVLFVIKRLAICGVNVIVHTPVLDEKLPVQSDEVATVYPAEVVVAVMAYASPKLRIADAELVTFIMSVDVPLSSTVTVDVAPSRRPRTSMTRVLVEAQPLVHAGFSTVIVDEAVLVLVLVKSGDSVTVAQFVSGPVEVASTVV
jgi:hypothetical protein